MSPITFEDLPDGAVQLLLKHLDSRNGGMYRPSQVSLIMYRAQEQMEMVPTRGDSWRCSIPPRSPRAALCLPKDATKPGASPSTSATAPATRAEWAKDPSRRACLAWGLGDDWLDLPLPAWGPVAWSRAKVQITGTDTFEVAAGKLWTMWESAGRPGDPAGQDPPTAAVVPLVPAVEVAPERPVYRDNPVNAPAAPSVPPEQPVGTHRTPREDVPPPHRRDRAF